MWKKDYVTAFFLVTLEWFCTLFTKLLREICKHRISTAHDRMTRPNHFKLASSTCVEISGNDNAHSRTFVYICVLSLMKVSRKKTIRGELH